MTPTRERITTWLTYLVPIAALALVVWAPGVFDFVLNHIRRYSLELALPAFTHGYMLWRVWLYRGRKQWSLRVACSLVSGASLASLYAHYTFTVFALVTGIPGLYAIGIVILQHGGRQNGNA